MCVRNQMYIDHPILHWIAALNQKDTEKYVNVTYTVSIYPWQLQHLGKTGRIYVFTAYGADALSQTHNATW